MERPKLNNYLSGSQIEFSQEHSSYVSDLEKYCTHLQENANKSKRKLFNDFFDYLVKYSVVHEFTIPAKEKLINRALEIL